MVARSDSMFGCYDSYSYRLWSLANVWNTCQLPPLTNGIVKEEELGSAADYFIKCSQCQKGCQSFLALKEHMETSHAESAASSENGTLSNPSALSPTPSLVASGGPFACSQCSSSFATKDQLEKHELLHSPNAQVSCKICGKTFANVYRLQRHMISHDESAVLRKFKCTECDKAFKFKHHLKEHIRIHSGEKPFECGNCGKRFSHSGSYSSHMTSKKCLVMNLKLGRTRAPTSSAIDKHAQQNLRLLKRANDSPMNNNNMSASPDQNSYLPILPKYSEAAAAFLQSSLAANSPIPPFYLTPPGLLSAPHSYNLPTLSQILDQIQQRVSPARTCYNENNESRNAESPVDKEIDVESSPEDPADNPPKSSASSCGDLVMDEDVKDDEEIKKEPVNEGNEQRDLEAVKRILETVNASVTKQFLQANMQKFSYDSSNNTECQNTSFHNSPKTTASLNCKVCNRYFDKSTQLEEHECDVQSEGLAAKLEEAITCKSEDMRNERRDSFSGNEDTDYDRTKNIDDVYCESVTTTDHVSEDGRKVRVRSLISDGQLKVLKDNYALNPRPKREDLEKIATTIGFPVRVVQVWFQNTRARDRREGRLIHVPYSPTAPVNNRFPPSALPSSLNQDNKVTVMNNYIADEPLDLSTKRSGYHSSESTPSSSPARPTSVNPKSEFCDEVVNLSRKSPRSPVQCAPYWNSYHNSNSSEIPAAPSPTEMHNTSRLAQILAQPAHKLNLPGMGLVPMEQLVQFGVTDLPSLSQLINNNQISNSLSPNSDKRWSDFKDMKIDVGEEDAINLSKRFKMSQYMLKSLGSPLLGNQETEPEGQFICDQCDKAFSKQSSLARHKYEHSGQRPHKCDECPKAFKHKHHLTEHKRLHSGEKPFQCTKCLKRFSHSGSYSQHMNHRYSYCKPYRE